MASGDWTDEENDLIVADYFAMLADDLAGRPYSKAEHNRNLQARVGRSRGSIEFKHMNISAVLTILAEDTLRGYRPAFNIQAALIDAVARWLARHPAWFNRPLTRTAAATEALVQLGPAPTLRNHPPLKPRPPRGDAWVHEIKFDGYRLKAQVRGDRAKLLTRGGQDWTDRFGAVAEALAALPTRTAILDGELVVEAASGASDFPALQADLAAGRSDRFRYYLFDLLYLDGRDLRQRPLVERKAALAELLAGVAAPLRVSEHFEEDGEVDAEARLPAEPRGPGVEAARRRLSDRAQPVLDQVEMFGAAGVRRRWLRGFLGGRASSSDRWCSAPTATSSSFTSGGSAPASVAPSPKRI